MYKMRAELVVENGDSAKLLSQTIAWAEEGAPLFCHMHHLFISILRSRSIIKELDCGKGDLL